MKEAGAGEEEESRRWAVGWSYQGAAFDEAGAAEDRPSGVAPAAGLPALPSQALSKDQASIGLSNWAGRAARRC